MTGSMIGVSIRIAGLTSMNVPIIRISTSNISAMPQAGMFMLMKKLATMSGTFWMVSTQVKMEEKPMMIMTLEEEMSVFLSAFQTSFQVSSL